jgi:hypothetical protein
LALCLAATLALAACDRGNSSAAAPPPPTTPDSMGSPPRAAHAVQTRGHADLLESSAATASVAQPGIWFTLNDSGHEPILYAFDTTGQARGRWLLRDARNSDWEAASYGPCGGSMSTNASTRCVYVGDTGDNNADARSRSIYRVAEPRASSSASGALASLSAARVRYRYSEGPRDVEAMYVAPDASIYLITKRPATNGNQPTRRALVFRLPSSAWSASSVQVAELVDSLPIVLGSAFARFITDAALSSDAKYLAVRTYTQVYVFATDPANGRVKPDVAPAVCNIASLEEAQGEGITWLADTHRLLFTSEGRGSPFRLANCALP